MRRIVVHVLAGILVHRDRWWRGRFEHRPRFVEGPPLEQFVVVAHRNQRRQSRIELLSVVVHVMVTIVTESIPVVVEIAW